MAGLRSRHNSTMKTEKMIALRNMYYGRDLKAGEEFEASNEHVQALVLTNAASLVEDESDKSKRYARRDMRAEK